MKAGLNPVEPEALLLIARFSSGKSSSGRMFLFDVLGDNSINGYICPLSRILLRSKGRGILDLHSGLFAESLEGPNCKLGPVVTNENARNPEVVQNPLSKGFLEMGW